MILKIRILCIKGVPSRTYFTVMLWRCVNYSCASCHYAECLCGECRGVCSAGGLMFFHTAFHQLWFSHRRNFFFGEGGGGKFCLLLPRLSSLSGFLTISVEVEEKVELLGFLMKPIPKTSV